MIKALAAGILIGTVVTGAAYNTVFVDYTKATILPDGGIYTGSYKEGLMHGQGSIEWPGGSSYEGDFLDGMMTGSGKILYADGSEYEGMVVDGLAQGLGTLKTDAATYTGEFNGDRFEGDGDYLLKNGNRYVGEFVKGEFQGTGTYTYSEVGVYIGEFVEGAFTGEGTYTGEDGNHYEGAFEDWTYKGPGTLTDKNGNQYIGTFSNSSIEGQGKYIGSDGAFYEGEFLYNYYHGQGNLKTASGDVYEGGFDYGQYEGTGKLIRAKPLDGITLVSGEWKNGTLVKADDPEMFTTSEEIAETVLYNQNQLLEESIDLIQTSAKDTADLYFLGIAGYGSEAVFRREVLYAKKYFDANLGTTGKSLALINDRLTISDYPRATRTSLKRTLGAIADKMNPQNDILFIYLSSHGSKDHQLSLNQPGLKIADLSASEFAANLESLPVRWKVIVVSACYSGGFIPHLENENTLVITASASDKTSFGCSDENEFTYFGEAFFKDALPNAISFVDAFEKAKEIVKIKEAGNDYELSDPKISKPQPILSQLKTWRTAMVN